MQKFNWVILLIGIVLNVRAQQPVNQQPMPSKAQLEWHALDFYLFMHFGPNTFTNKEWGHGDEPASVFNPSDMDCQQWARIAKASGAKGIVITAKHHDGFCLWPSAYSQHTVRESPWKNGQGDVLKELSKACRDHGLLFGIYISPWDRNHPAYGTSAYNDVYISTMKEAVTQYGPIFEMWWDGANGEGPNGKRQVYDFKRFESTIRSIAPNAVVFSDIGPDIRWVGNENGFAGKTNWNFLDTAGYKRGAGGPPNDTLLNGNVYGKNWIPAEVDVSIRPGWFYHKEEDSLVKSGEDLMKIYLKSVGRGANLILNVPPDRRGRIHEIDSAALIHFKDHLTAFYKSRIASKFIQVVDTCYEIHIPQTRTFNTLLLQEDLRKGQHVSAFVVEVWDGARYLPLVEGTTIGKKRIVQFPPQLSSRMRIRITGHLGEPTLLTPSVYRAATYQDDSKNN